MLNWGLVISLVLTTLANPLVCCCAVRHRADAPTSLAQGLQHRAGCCAHRDGTPSDSHGSHEQDHGPCRCKEHGKPPATVQPSGPDLDLMLRVAAALDFGETFALWDAYGAGLTLAPEEARGDAGGVSFPHLSGREILSTLQTLRC